MWAEKVLRKVQDMYDEDEVLMLTNKKTYFFKNTFNFNISYLEAAIIGHCYDKGSIFSLYELFASGSNKSSESKLRLWKEDIDDEISLEDWNEACKKAQMQTINSSLKRIQYKWLMRTYITPAILLYSLIPV